MKRPYFCLYGCYVPPASLVKELTSMDDVEMIVPGAAEACCIVRLITWRLRCSVIANTQNPKFEYGDNLFQAMHCIVTWSSQSVKAIASHSSFSRSTLWKGSGPQTMQPWLALQFV